MVIQRSIALGLALISSVAVGAQGRRGGAPSGAVRTGKTERVMIRDREVLVYLPPSYGSDAARRFPVVYLLAERPVENLNLTQAADRLAGAQGFSEPIVVLPDAAAAGDWEKFVAEDLVTYVDGHYSTIAARISRGLAGYSAGGDAALRIAMTRPEVFSSLYVLSASIADASAAMLDGSAASLRRYYAIAINVSTTSSALASSRRLHDAMTRLEIPHYYEEYDGAEVSERIETRVLPFFSRNLSAPANPTSPAVQ